jgi:hypothetical protein
VNAIQQKKITEFALLNSNFMFGPESIIYCSYHLTTNSAFQMGEKATVRDPLLFFILFIFSAVKLNSFFKLCIFWRKL